MRSTFDIADALDKELRDKAVELGVPVKEALNRALAAGLSALSPKSPQRPGYKVRAKKCGFQEGVDLLHLNRFSSEVEDQKICE